MTQAANQSIRFGQAGFRVQRLLALRRVFARTMSFRMIAVMASLGGFPAWTKAVGFPGPQRRRS
jgi:hypothetical protein